MEINELSRNANGGTEMMLRRLHRDVPKDLLDKFQIIPTRVRELDPDRKRILWVHDLPNDPEVARLKDPEYRKQFDGIVFVSHWQRAVSCAALNIPHGATTVMENAIEQFTGPLGTSRPSNVIRLVYHTTPHRGLNLLVAAFAKVHERDPDVRLDVFSSFKAYGWPERDKPYESLFQFCRDHVAINYHGYQPNDVVRDFLWEHAHIFAYPSTWTETSCIAAIEAMCAGCLVVCSDLGALPDTLGGMGYLYRYDEDPSVHAARHADRLQHGIDFIRSKPVNSMDFIATYANSRYDWRYRAKQWEAYLRSLL